MSEQNEVRRLQRDLIDDRDLWRRMETACERITRKNAAIHRPEAIARAAKECGYAITPDDVKNSLAALEATSGKE